MSLTVPLPPAGIAAVDGALDDAVTVGSNPAAVTAWSTASGDGWNCDVRTMSAGERLPVLVDVQVGIAVEGQRELVPIQLDILLRDDVAHVRAGRRAAWRRRGCSVTVEVGQHSGFATPATSLQPVEQRGVRLPEGLDLRPAVDAEQTGCAAR